MPKILTFKKRKDFLRVAAGFHVVTHNLVLQATRSLCDTEDIWVGFTATKKIGNAVCRNRSKRRLRAIAREALASWAASHVDYVFIARNSTFCCDYSELLQDAIYAIKKINKNFLIPETDANTSSCDGVILKNGNPKEN
jgi:ribonuclease P protein component